MAYVCFRSRRRWLNETRGDCSTARCVVSDPRSYVHCHHGWSSARGVTTRRDSTAAVAFRRFPRCFRGLSMAKGGAPTILNDTTAAVAFRRFPRCYAATATLPFVRCRCRRQW